MLYLLTSKTGVYSISSLCCLSSIAGCVNMWGAMHRIDAGWHWYCKIWFITGFQYWWLCSTHWFNRLIIYSVPGWIVHATSLNFTMAIFCSCYLATSWASQTLNYYSRSPCSRSCTATFLWPTCQRDIEPSLLFEAKLFSQEVTPSSCKLNKLNIKLPQSFVSSSWLYSDIFVAITGDIHSCRIVHSVSGWLHYNLSITWICSAYMCT